MRRRRSTDAVNALDKNSRGSGGSHESDRVILSPSMASIGEEIRFSSDNANEGSSSEGMLPNSQPSETGDLQRFRRHRTSLAWVFTAHFLFLFCVVLLGIIYNGGKRKFIPVDTKGLTSLLVSLNRLEEGMFCRKAYVNVHSSSFEDEFSAICCTGHENTFSNPYESNLCSPKTPFFSLSMGQLPFSKSLTRMPEAWIFPLLPIVIRLGYQLLVLAWFYVTQCWNSNRYQKIVNKWTSKKNDTSDRAKMHREGISFSYHSELTSTSSIYSESSDADSSAKLDGIVVETSSLQPSSSKLSSAHSQSMSLRSTVQRLVFYFVVLNFRGWVLYIGANALEDYVILPWLTGDTVISPIRTDSMSDEEHNLHFTREAPKCWYKEILKPHHKLMMEGDDQAACYGRPFDFSDHVVLFLAHYFPIFMMEMYFCYLFPFWECGTPSNRVAASASKSFQKRELGWISLLVLSAIYLHLLILHSVYQTAVYFHTPGEVFVGYIVSLSVQLPIGYLTFSERLSRIRQIVGFPTGKEGNRESLTASDKGD
ncbi:hypothetical protein ACHAXS_007527 [Conticribra weissflogii]